MKLFRIIAVFIFGMSACSCLAQLESNTVERESAIRRTINRFNFATVSYFLKNDLWKFNNTFTRYGELNSSGDTDTTYNWIKKSIPLQRTDIAELCDEIERMKSNLPEKIDSLFINYLVFSIHSEGLPSDPSGFRYRVLDSFYRREGDVEAFSNYRYDLRPKLIAAWKKDLIDPDLPLEQNSRNRLIKWFKDHIVESFGLISLFVLSFLLLMRSKVKSNSKVLQNLAFDVEEKIGKLTKLLQQLKVKQDGQHRINEGNEIRFLELSEFSLAISGEDFSKLDKRVGLIENYLVQEIERTGITSTTLTTGKIKKQTSDSEKFESQQVLFFPVPDKRTGYFRTIMGKERIQGYSVYQVTIDKSNAKSAMFELIQNSQVETAALNFPELYLFHACKIQGDHTSAKRIRTIKPGNLVLDGDLWIIKEKSVICYE